MDKILSTLSGPREDYKPHTPRIVKLYIEKDQIGAVIGSGGKIIQDLQKRSDTIITIKEIGNQGEVEICGSNAASIDLAISFIKALTTEPEIGANFSGVVKNIQPFGAFIEFLPGIDGLCHISELEWRRLDKVEEVLAVGDKIEVKLIGMDKGKYKLSRKVLLPKP
jgi:polyribonucleotide nucleotidyltransferase